MPRPIQFEIHSGKPERAIAFYTAAFGWRITPWRDGEYWVIRTGPPTEPGIDGGLVLRKGIRPGETQPVNAFVCTIEVPSIDEYVTRVERAGGRIVVQKMRVENVGWVAYAKDTEGNMFGMMQREPQVSDASLQ